VAEALWVAALGLLLPAGWLCTPAVRRVQGLGGHAES
jgi:hypothetical protein